MLFLVSSALSTTPSDRRFPLAGPLRRRGTHRTQLLARHRLRHPLALLVTEFAGHQRTGDLVAERAVDTLVGALVGFAAVVAVTNRRAGDRVLRSLTAVDRARESAVRVLAEPQAPPRALETARHRLAAALADLLATADAAAGEWRQRAVPRERVVLAEQAGHRTLAATVRRRGPLPGTSTHTEDVRP